ncbi:MAG: T9SS type A sorting domain-containing protein [Bacteroidales bacterium]
MDQNFLKILITLLNLLIFNICFAQFTGLSGVYYLGTANISNNISVFSNPNISGVVVRFNWDNIEHSPGVFNWTYIDEEIAKAVAYNKKVSLQPLDVPHWLDSIGTQHYYHIDNNSFHSTYGQIISDVITWDSIYVNRYRIFLQNLSTKYASNSTVSYINTIGGSFSRGLPDTVITDTLLMTKQAFWAVFNYNADSLGELMNKMTDYYMNLFPSTHLWCSTDYVSFESKASGRPINYLATLYSNYGITHYPDRFGLWREDLSGCNPQSVINTGNQWYILHQNPCRTGAQMLWNVQDGPLRMNKCGIIPNQKSIVLDSALNNGLSLGMRYLEIYGVDINDVSLSNSIQQANNKLIAYGAICDSILSNNENKVENYIKVYPNPFNIETTIKYKVSTANNVQLSIFDMFGREVKTLVNQYQSVGNYSVSLNASELSLKTGIYYYKITMGNYSKSMKMICIN